MAQYTDKDVLVAEIESRIKSMEECFNGKFPMSQSVKETEQDKGKLVAYKSILSLINTIEVKEVDLEREIPMWIKENPRERPFDDGWFIGMDDCLHRNGYKIKICDLWDLPKEPFNSKEFETI